MLCFLWCKINWNFPWGLVWILVHHILTSDVFGWDKKVEIIKGLPKSYLSFSQKSKIVVFSYSENCGFSSIAYLSEPVPHFFSYDKSQFFFFSIEESWMSFSLELGSDLVQNLFQVFFFHFLFSLTGCIIFTDIESSDLWLEWIKCVDCTKMAVLMHCPYINICCISK